MSSPRRDTSLDESEGEDDVIRSRDVEIIPPGSQNAALLRLIQNPSALQSLFDLNPQQAENVRSLITGSGSGLGAKALSQYVGTPLAGAIGGFLGGYVAEKILGKG